MGRLDQLPASIRAPFLAQVGDAIRWNRENLSSLPVSRQTWWRWSKGAPVRRAQAERVSKALGLQFDFLTHQRSRVRLHVPDFTRALSVKPTTTATALRASRGVLFALASVMESQGFKFRFSCVFGQAEIPHIEMLSDAESRTRVVLEVQWVPGSGYVLQIATTGATAHPNTLVSGTLTTSSVQRILAAIKRITDLETQDQKRKKQVSQQVDNFFRTVQ